MKKSLFLMGLFALLISCKGNVSKNIPQTDKPQPVNLILDTDLGPDYDDVGACLLYTSPSPRDRQKSRMPSSA